MNTMTISPMQHDFINKGEFDNFKDHVDDRFDDVDERFDEQKKYMLDGFNAMDRKIDLVYGELSSELKVIKEVQADHTEKLDRIDSSLTQVHTSLTLLTKIATKIADKI